MKRFQKLSVIGLGLTSVLAIIVLLSAGSCRAAAFDGPGLLFFSTAAQAAEPQTDTIAGTWLLSLPMPGGTMESVLVLKTDGDKLSGTMSNPGTPTDVHPVYDGSFRNGQFRLSADIGRITYFLEGTQTGKQLAFEMTTTETIPLGDGSRLSGKTGEISGRYLVPVYSPGGIMENHFELIAENGVITGQMYVPVTGTEGSSGGTDAPPPNAGGPSAGGIEGAQPAQRGGGMASDSPDAGKRDVNTFYDGTYEGNRISLYTKTAQGSLFHFTGTVEEDAIKLTLHVTDQRTGLEASRKN